MEVLHKKYIKFIIIQKSLSCGKREYEAKSSAADKHVCSVSLQNISLAQVNHR